jgi:hypothetical protein
MSRATRLIDRLNSWRLSGNRVLHIAGYGGGDMKIGILFVLAVLGADATFLPPDEFLAFMKAEWAKWGPVVKATGAKAD